MLRKYFFLILLTFVCLASFAQGEADNWLFGANAGVNFGTGNPTYITGGQINTLEGCASISDPQGILLFYTDGSRVWDKNNAVMPNGTGLFGDDSSTSSGLIVPSPGNSNIYYIFTVDEPHHEASEGPNRGLNYTVVDLTLNGGSGDVVSGQKNIPLITYDASDSNENKYKCSEKITAVRSADCNSFWVVTHFINKYFSFKVDNVGVDANPVVSVTPLNVPLSGYRRNALGYLKASPDGGKLAVAHQGFATSQGANAPGGVFLYDFDSATGVVSNELEVYNRTNGNSPYGVEFSRSGQKLYASVGGGASGAGTSQLVQYDLSIADIASSETIVNTSNAFSSGAIQIAPDGKIYRALFNFNNGDGSFLGVVNNPELAGAACNYVEQGFVVNNPATAVNEASRIGLPPFIQSLFAEKVDIINNDNDASVVTNTLTLCEGETYTLAAENIAGATYTWTFNGNEIVNTTFELVDVSVAGTYLVEIDPNNGDCPFFGEAIVTILDAPIINSITPLEECLDTSDGLSDFNLSNADADALNNQLPNVVVDSYHRLEADALSGINPITSPYASSGETIYIRILNTDTGCFNAVPVDLIVNSLPVIASPVSLEQCDTDANGVVTFNLTEANVLLSSNSANETFMYYNTLADAQTGVANLAIQNPTSFQSATGVTVYASVTNENGCVSYGQVDLLVGTSTIPSSTAYLFSACDDDYDGVTAFDFSSVESQITSIFPASVSITISYYENEADALSEINAIPDISNHQNTNSPNNQAIWVRVDSQDLNGCLGLGEHVFLSVNPLPDVVEIDDVFSCSDTDIGVFDLSNATIQAQNGVSDVSITYHETQEQAELGVAPLGSPYVFNDRTLYIRAFNNLTGCYTSSMSVDLIVNPNPVLSNPEPIQQCDDAVADGFTTFNLLQDINEILDESADYSVSFYTIASDAIAGSGTSFIVNPEVFVNTVNPQNVYIRVENVATGCFSVTSQSLEVVAPPNGFPLAGPLSYCDTDNDGIGYFDLNAIVSSISGGQAPGDVAVEFFETQVNADLGVDAIDTSVLYENLNADNQIQTIYAVLSINDLSCTTVVEIDLLVLNSPDFEFTDEELTYALCADVGNTTGILVYNLVNFARDENELNIDTAFDIAFYEALDASGEPIVLIANPSSYNNTSQGQIVYMTVSDSNIVDSNGEVCIAIIPITLQVDLLPAANNYFDYVLCDDDFYGEMDDTQVFDLPSQLPNMIASTTGIMVSYYENWNIATGELTNQIPDSELETYENIANPQDVFVAFENELGCSIVKILKLSVSPNPTPLSNSQIIATLGNQGVLEACDGNVDGSGDITEQVAVFDVTQWETSILNGETGVSASYHETFDAASAGIDAIVNPTSYSNTSNPQTIYVSVLSDGTGLNALGKQCATIVQFDLYVPMPEIRISASKEVICINANGIPLTNVDLPILTAIGGPQASSLYNYQWLLNGVSIPGANSETYTVTTAGDYSVIVSGPTNVDCINTSLVQTISASGEPDEFNVNVTTQAFADAHQIVATATSTNSAIVFWYRLDDGEATNNGTFNDVSPGVHTVTITDEAGCWSYQKDLVIIDYPRFFTPNGDGINDTWAIIEQQEIPIAQIYIFDRFGKLLKQLEPGSSGWDGMYNGNPMLATDYWFKIIYIEGAAKTQKEFKAHFSLKR